MEDFLLCEGDDWLEFAMLDCDWLFEFLLNFDWLLDFAESVRLKFLLGEISTFEREDFKEKFELRLLMSDKF